MTDGAKNVFNFMKAHPGEEMTKQAIAAALEVPVATVTGSTNWLLKQGYATERVDEVEVEGGKKKTVKYVQLTDAGLAYDPDAAEAAAKEAKEREKAAKAAERAAAKANKAND